MEQQRKDIFSMESKNKLQNAFKKPVGTRTKTEATARTKTMALDKQKGCDEVNDKHKTRHGHAAPQLE